MPQHAAGAEERQVQALRVGGDGRLPLRQRPALVVPLGQQRLVVGQEVRMVDYAVALELQKSRTS